MRDLELNLEQVLKVFEVNEGQEELDLAKEFIKH
ncbi:MAG: hypothetical protein JWN83_2059 [Chitinophagaceae bacterium]|nr:hypothetical protein [Chitinophagaceae bacterium]